MNKKKIEPHWLKQGKNFGPFPERQRSWQSSSNRNQRSSCSTTEKINSSRNSSDIVHLSRWISVSTASTNEKLEEGRIKGPEGRVPRMVTTGRCRPPAIVYARRRHLPDARNRGASDHPMSVHEDNPRFYFRL
jgi:hypothetical protein